jgi:hypothetical protein
VRVQRVWVSLSPYMVDRVISPPAEGVHAIGLRPLFPVASAGRASVP